MRGVARRPRHQPLFGSPAAATRVTSADVLCLLLSPTSVASPWVEREIELARAEDARGLRILPVILRPCAIPPELAGLVALDATDGLDVEHVRLRLVAGVVGKS